ncbi:MAG: carboxypeptidase regulatory-like domain-containing protein [Methanolobus sp.]|nr:carboxypeptidase regulatory-like domain-containing protein [Methanolobus sp.]
MIENRTIGKSNVGIIGIFCLIMAILLASVPAIASAEEQHDVCGMELIDHTICDANGNYVFENLANGDYSLVAVNWSSKKMLWYTGSRDITLAGTSLTDQNIKINSTAGIDQDYIFGLLNRSDLSGMTYVMKPDYPRQSTVVLLDQQTKELVADTMSDETGIYSFTGIPDGDYSIVAVNYSTDKELWYRGISNIKVKGSDLREQNIKVSSSTDIDENFILGLLNRSEVSGMTYVMKPDYPRQSTVVLLDQQTKEMVADTMSDATGMYSFTGIPDGDYSIVAVNYSTDKELWYRGITNITLTGSDLTEQNIKVSSSTDIDENFILGLTDKSSVSGVSYVMKLDYPRESTVVLLQNKTEKLFVELPSVPDDADDQNTTDPQEPPINTTDDEGLTFAPVFKYFSNTASDEFGDYQFTDVPNGNYLIKAVQYSTAMNGMWLTNVQNITVQDGQPIADLNLSMRLNNDIDHLEILSFLNRTTIAGKTISKKGTDKAYVDVILTTPNSEFIVNTTSDEFGDYQFSDVQNGDYLIKAVQYSTAMDGMWLTNVQNITVENGQPIADLNLSMRKNDDIEHQAILGLLDRTTISGKTISKKGTNRAYVDVMLTTPNSELIFNTTSDEFGNYQFNDVQNDDYFIKAAQYSTAMDGMWLTNVQNITVENGQPIADLNLSMRKNDDIDHQEIMDLLDRTTISGKTISKKGANKTFVDIVLLKESFATVAKPSNAPHLNVSIVTGYANYEVQLADFAERINNNPDLNMTASYHLAEKLSNDVDLSHMDIIYINMFTSTAYKLQETVQDAIDNGALVIGYNTYLPQSEYDIPVRFNNDAGELKSHLQEYWLNGASNSENFDNLMFFLASEYYDREDLTVEEPIGPPGSAIYHRNMTDTSAKFFTDNATEYFQWYANRADGHVFDEDAPTIGITFYKSYYPLNMNPLDALVQGFEEKGVNVVACYGTASDPIDIYLNHDENTKVDAVISFNYRGNYFDISELDVPVINGVLNGYMNTSQWINSSNPIPVNRMLRLYGPETDGLFDPIMIGAKEIDLVNGGDKYVPHPAQVEWLIERTLAQANLSIEDDSDNSHSAGRQ